MSAERTSQAAVAAERLCAALWEALRDRLAAGEAEEAAALGERIAEVSRSVSALVRAGGGVPPDSEPRVPLQGAAPAQSGPGAAPVDSPQASWAHPGMGEHRGSAAGAAAGSGIALLVDEHASREASIAIRDARHEAQASPWGIAVQRRLDRYAEGREPFAVLLLELLDAERLRLAQSPVDADREVRDVEAAIVEQLRPADALVREAEGRYWLIAPHTDRAAARALAIRIAGAARRSASRQGVPLEVAAGIAICPQHGEDVGALTGHAEVDLYAAESAGALLSEPEEGSTA